MYVCMYVWHFMIKVYPSRGIMSNKESTQSGIPLSAPRHQNWSNSNHHGET
jgi:hypothetical protein